VPARLWGVALVVLATSVRLGWVLAVPTVPVSDFAMYRESANYLSEFGHLDRGFIYMPGFVALLAWVQSAGGDLLAQKLLGVGFGGLGAAGLFVVSHRLVDTPTAVVATLAYALWPAGIGMSSVVGTDMPAAALLVSALALLVWLGSRRPLAGAVAFGVAMGLAAWMRAVALPLTALAGGIWLAERVGLRRAVAYTAVGVATTLVVLSPWAVRHLRASGQLYFTDDHGGITALIGANPNSEGTYTRALNQLFKDVTGKSVLDEPHRETDRAAYAMAREWMRFDPAYTLGLALEKADRLFDPEHRLMYWSVLRPGVLVGRPARVAADRRAAIVALADGFGFAVAALALAGIAVAVARRRWALLALLPFQFALTATYVVFFAEPRYRLPIEILAFPFGALALVETARVLAAVRRNRRAGLAAAARLLGPAVAVIVVWRLGWPAAIEAGRGLRMRHRWAVTVAAVDGGMRTLLWRRLATTANESPVAGAPAGVHVAVAPPDATRLGLVLGGGALPAGAYHLSLRLQAAAGGDAWVSVSGVGVDSAGVDVPASGAATLETHVAHRGGAFALYASLRGPQATSVWASDASLLLDSEPSRVPNLPR